jgi:hypothetical protein
MQKTISVTQVYTYVMTISNLGYESVHWIQPAQGSFLWRILVNTVMHVEVSHNGVKFFTEINVLERRSQWPPAQTLGSWSRIPLEAWMSVCVYSVFVLFCVQVAASRRADFPSLESYRLSIRLRN